MGTLPTTPLIKPFNESIREVEAALQADGFKVTRVYRGQLAVLSVEENIVIGDNLEAEPGQVYNIAANLDYIDFSGVIRVAEVVRNHNEAARNIAFGGHLGDSTKLLDSIEVRANCVGVNAPKSGVYEKGFQVTHMGFGVNHHVQVPVKLATVGIETTLIGKVADIVENPYGTSFVNLVDTNEIFRVALDAIRHSDKGFFCINVQETDLSGHRQDPDAYWSALEKADNGLEAILSQLNKEDVLVVTADHGNDPFIGHGQHTREKVPLLVKKYSTNSVRLGTRTTLADIGASVADYFDAPKPESGTSFISLLQ